MGMKCFDQCDFRKAIVYHQLHLNIAKEAGDRAGEGDAYANLGIAFNSLSDFKKAIEYHQLHLGIAKELGSKESEGGAYTNLGIAYRCMGDFKTAIEYHKLHLKLLQDNGNRSAEGIAQCNLGIAYDCLDNFKEAIKCHQQHLDIAKEVGDRASEGMAYTNLGIAYHHLGDFQKALECQRSHIPIAKEVGNIVGEGCAYANLGKAHHSLGNFEQAKEYYQLHLNITKRVGDRAGEGSAYGNLGNAYQDSGDFKTALKYYYLELDIVRDIGDRDGERVVYGSLGNAFYSLGNFKKAVEFHKLDLNIAKEMGSRSKEALAYNNLGIAYMRLGDLEKAIEYIQHHLNVAKEIGDKASEGRAYGNIGSAYASLGEFKLSIKYHKLHLENAQDLGDVAGEGEAYGNLGSVYHHLGDFETASQYHHQHLDIAKKVENKDAEGRAYSSLGIHHHSLGKTFSDEKHFKKAIEYHQLHLSISKEVGARSQEARANTNLGAVYDALGDYKKAIEYHQLFLNICKELEDTVGESVAYCNLGNAYGSLGDLAKAEGFFKSSVRLLDKLRDSLHSKDELKVSLRDYYKGPYTALWMVLLQQKKISEALFAADRGRGQALMDLMESRYNIETTRDEIDDDTKEISEIFSKISSPTVFVAIGQTTINFWVLKKENEGHFLYKEIDKTLLKENAITTLASLNEYAYSKIGVLESVQCENRSLDDPLDETLPDQNSEESKPVSPEDEEDPLKLLHELVIDPILDLVQGGDLTIVPDGPLLLAPFAAFKDQHSRYLSETFPIRLIPTLSSLKMMAECSERDHSTTGALLVGDPWLGTVRIKGRPPNQLPNAKKEIEMIGKILGTDPLTDKKATKAHVLSKLSSVALVHIAAHGKAETGEIMLSPNPTTYKTPKEKDYLLTMEDVKNAKLNARLVVLSCCHSGRGKIKAEGVVGIARAFLGAGARSVLASLWAIDDAATFKFMEMFYKQLVEEKHSASKSLNQAMKQMRESESFNDLRLWAPFVLIGDDVTLDFAQTL